MVPDLRRVKGLLWRLKEMSFVDRISLRREKKCLRVKKFRFLVDPLQDDRNV